MAFGLVIGTDRANALQQAIQDELSNRGYNPDADHVMAEYITIMIINNKTKAQITSELEDSDASYLLLTLTFFVVIGSDFNPTFTDWLFEEAAKGDSGPDISPQSPTLKPDTTTDIAPTQDTPQVANDSSRTPNVARGGVYQQAISQALPSTSGSAQKRSSSARSPSPSHPNKSRRTDLPTGPRAMYRDGPQQPHANQRSLLDRVGGPAGRGPKNFQRDEIQARIDNIVGNSPEPNMMMPPGFPGMGMDMSALAAANMANPIMLQEMMMNQMALMAQMATSMGIINPATGQFNGPGFPMQGPMPPEMAMLQNQMNNGFPQQQQQQQGVPNGHMNGTGRGRGGVRGRGTGRRGGAAGGPDRPSTTPKPADAATSDATTAQLPAPIAAPTPIAPSTSTSAPSAAARAAAPVAQSQPMYAVPERPQSPTLCKFGLKCTNAHCRYSHPSPVATPESGIVLSNEACEKGKDCKDKDCIKAHVSPAALNPQAQQPVPQVAAPPPPQVHHNPVPCRFGAACTRPGCTFNHPPRPTQSGTPCKFGAACTRANCAFQHPPGRVLPSTFHRGLATTGPMVNVPTPETGSMGGSQHKSVTFNKGMSAKERLEKQMKDLEEKKNQAEQAVKDAEAAAAKKAADANPVSITA
ncbi:hypothetical protein CVT26_015669 [Gymnopilus dilepis]|uniref:Nab2 type CCCH zinc finger 4 domain-containing protein n=1 Tax=Gymnopilus dilepis TaxID=231916 RepID=A0A409VFC6_9AGAR|nr:hypothetical protein CVT26_015669 [Gymnopilus dilepis]